MEIKCWFIVLGTMCLATVLGLESAGFYYFNQYCPNANAYLAWINPIVAVALFTLVVLVLCSCSCFFGGRLYLTLLIISGCVTAQTYFTVKECTKPFQSGAIAVVVLWAVTAGVIVSS